MKKDTTRKNASAWRTLLAGFLAAAVFAGICASNIMYAQDCYVSDALYQQPSPQDGQIVLINLDQKSLDALGPFQSWGRALMGDVINMLNQDPEQAPAVIALDVLYVGESDDPEGDSYLAEACANSCPVVVACAGTFGSQLVENADGSFYMDEYSLIAFDEPYGTISAIVYHPRKS